jgi:UDP-glucuronate 4-epimerase
MASHVGVCPSINDPFIYIQSNIVGTTLLMELAAKFKIENFVFASSSSIYSGSNSTYFSKPRTRTWTIQ